MLGSGPAGEPLLADTPQPRGGQGRPNCLCRQGLVELHVPSPAPRGAAGAKAKAAGSVSLPMAGRKGSPSPAAGGWGRDSPGFRLTSPVMSSWGKTSPGNAGGQAEASSRTGSPGSSAPGAVPRWALLAAPWSHPPPAPAECLGVRD